MLKKLIFFILFLHLFFPQKSYAEGIEFNEKQWRLGLIAMIPSFPLTIILHEGMHSFAATSMGARITDFRIWPSILDNKLSLGYVNIERDLPFTPRQYAFFALAPQITNALLFCVTESLFYCNTVSSQSPVAPFIFVFGELFPWIGFTTAFIHSSDVENVEKFAHVPRYVIRPIGAVVSAIGAYFMIKRGYQIFFQKRRHRPKYKKPCNFSIESGTGIMLTIKF